MLSKRSVCPRQSAGGCIDQVQRRKARNLLKGRNCFQTFHSRTNLVFYRVVFLFGLPYQSSITKSLLMTQMKYEFSENTSNGQELLRKKHRNFRIGN